MGVEIERKFLVRPGEWRPTTEGVRLRQGYLQTHPGSTVRVRRTPTQGWLTIKGPVAGMSRLEFEYAIPGDDADVLIGQLATAVIDKTRYRETHGSHVWEIDVFHGANEGLVVAEVELASEEETPELPRWAGAEVTADRRYANSALGRQPWSTWGRPPATSRT